MSENQSNVWRPWQPTATEPWDLLRVWHFCIVGPGLRRRERSLSGTLPTEQRRVLSGTSRVVAVGNCDRLKAWWVHRMLVAPDSLPERLTLMWHNHFATAASRSTTWSSWRCRVGTTRTRLSSINTRVCWGSGKIAVYRWYTRRRQQGMWGSWSPSSAVSGRPPSDSAVSLSLIGVPLTTQKADESSSASFVWNRSSLRPA